jgi:hypothetical protein
MKNLCFILAVLVCQALSAQSTEVSGKYDKIGKFVKGIALVHKNGLVGAISSDGKEIIKPEYDRISGFGDDGIAYTNKNGMVGLINKEGHVILNNEYDYIGHFKDGYATIRKKGLTGIVDKSGKIVVDIKYERLTCEPGGVFKATNPDGTEVLVKKNP